jgi:outer membrane protein assembly factor BamB
MQKNKTAIAIAMLLMMTMVVTMIASPAVIAHDPAWTIPTYAFVTAAPNTIGVGQTTVIVMWLDKFPATAGGTGGDLWRGFTLDITEPNGDKTSLGPFTSGQTGSTFTTFTPDQVGDYTIIFSWPGQTLTNGTGTPRASVFEGDYFEGSTSDPIILTVTQDPAPEWPEPPLPDYWIRPINSANREWDILASNWLGGSWLPDNIQSWGQAPNTGHILWSKPIVDGGIPDANYGPQHMQTTDYESMWSNPIVMNGYLYYYTGMQPDYGYYKVDLRTGEQIWYKNGTDNGIGQIVGDSRYQGLGGAGVYSGNTFAKPSFGQLLHYYSLNGEGVMEYLWMTSGSTWYMLDANTGNWVMSLAHVPGGTTITDQDGSILRYSYNGNTGNILAWNSTKSIGPPSPTGTGEQQWEPRIGHTIDAVNDSSWYDWGPRGGTSPIDITDILPRSGYTMNVTGPTGLPSLAAVVQDENKVPKLLVFRSLPGQSGLPGGTNDQHFPFAVVRIDEHAAPYSPFPDKPTAPQQTNLGFDVSLLYSKTFTYPLGGNRSWGFGPMSYEDDVWTLMCKESRQTWGYSLTTGQMLWGPTEAAPNFNMYEVGYTGRGTGAIAYGTLYIDGYGGKLYAIDLKTGDTKWVYEAKGIGFESPYGDYPINIATIADGKVFLYSTEHSPTTPLWRGSYLRAVNATDGTEVWKVLDFVQGFALADGMIVTGNWYDQQMYAYGKGPSATTVSIKNDVITLGNSVLIKGTVMDKSPGATQVNIGPRFPNGLPAVSDEDMSAWMEYVYETQVYPSDAKGVEVTLDTIDPNGNFVHIGTVTTDLSGTYSTMYTPEVPGKYTIIATFAGSESYGSSYAETAIGVTEAPVESAPTPTPASVADLYFVPVSVGIIVVIIAIGAVLIILTLRKR